MTNDLIWDFENNYPETDIESNELKVKITDSFINEMSVNREVSALGFLRGDGWGLYRLYYVKTGLVTLKYLEIC